MSTTAWLHEGRQINFHPRPSDVYPKHELLSNNEVEAPRNKAHQGCLGGSGGKASACNAGDLSLISGLGRSLGEGNGYPLQYFCLENSMDRGTWQPTVHRDTNERLSLSQEQNSCVSFLLLAPGQTSWLLEVSCWLFCKIKITLTDFWR